jgi:hypothetical protein
MEQHRAVGKLRPGANELGARLEQVPQGIDLAPLDRVARRLEAGVDRVVSVRPSRGPVRVPVVRAIASRAASTVSGSSRPPGSVARISSAALGLPRR